jgi:hypothetical protein
VQIETLFLQLAISVFVAIITVLVTVWLALRRFYREKWWEAKMRAYTDIIQALHHIKRDLEISIPAAMEHRDTETEFYKGWNAKHNAAWDDLRRYVDIGDFLFSSPSIQVLQTLITDASGHSDDDVEYMEMLQTAVEKCLPAIKISARSDLKLPVHSRPP